MSRISLFSILMLSSGLSSLWAFPATVENQNYKAVISETMPGLDSQGVPQLGPTITVTVQDKFRSSSLLYNLPLYAIHDYFMTGDNLNLLGRVSPKGDQGGPRYSFLQLMLGSNSDSRQFQDIKQFSFSPGNQYLIAVFDGKGQSDSIGLIPLGTDPAKLGWIYAPQSGVNLFQKALASMGQGVAIQDPVGWTADSSTAVFVARAQEGMAGTPTDTPAKDYLVFLAINGDDFKLAAEPVDLSAYHYRAGAIISDIKCEGDKATLFFSQSDSSDANQADFVILKPGGK